MLWPDSYVEEANLNHHVWTLRKTLGETPGGHRYIETVPRRGYRFIASVTELPDADDELVVERHSFTRIVTEDTKGKETGLLGETNPGKHLDALEALVNEQKRKGARNAVGKLRKHKLGIIAAALSVLLLVGIGGDTGLFFGHLLIRRKSNQLQSYRLSTRAVELMSIICQTG